MWAVSDVGGKRGDVKLKLGSTQVPSSSEVKRRRIRMRWMME